MSVVVGFGGAEARGLVTGFVMAEAVRVVAIRAAAGMIDFLDLERVSMTGDDGYFRFCLGRTTSSLDSTFCVVPEELVSIRQRCGISREAG